MMMNAADGAPLGGSVTKNSKKSVYPCLGEALMRGSFVERTVFMVRV